MPRKKAPTTAPLASEPATTLPEHSPLGASSAERWMNCPGSVALIEQLALPESDEEEWRAEGIAMHEAAAAALTNGWETWEIVGQDFHGVTITAELGMAIALYVEHASELIEGASSHGVEAKLHSAGIHGKAYGTADLWTVARDLRIRDLKGGAGIVVEAYRNPQMMYYAGLVIDRLERGGMVFDDGMLVDLGIVQPRAFHPDGPIRTWETTVGEIKSWIKTELVPAMHRTALDNTLTPGEWCRFCPATLVCPMLQGLFEALCKIDPTHVVNWSDESLDRSYGLVQSAMFAKKAIEEEVFKRANMGTTFEAGKLVQKRANRVLPSTVEIDGKPRATAELAEEVLGPDVWEPPSLKSPPNLEKLGPRGKEFVKEFAYTPDTGLTIAPRSDPRQERKAAPSSEVWKEALDAVNAGG